MRETRTYGSVRGARGDARPYRDQSPSQCITGWRLLSCPLSSSNPSLLHSNLRALDFPAAMIVQGRGRSTETSVIHL